MGRKINACPVYDVVYGDTAFEYKTEKFFEILGEYDVDYELNIDDTYLATHVDVDGDGYKRLLEEMPKNNPYYKHMKTLYDCANLADRDELHFEIF